MAKCIKEVCECVGSRLTLRMFCEHFNAERPENEVERESITMWSSLPDELRERALKHLRAKVPAEVVFKWYAQRRRGFAIGSDAIRFHFDVGMNVRNTLRAVVPDDELPWVARVNVDADKPALIHEPTQWDDYYYGALFDLVGGETSNPESGFTPSPYFAKCKRLRTDGPTPCLCCPDECVGDTAGFSYEEVVASKAARPWAVVFGAAVFVTIMLWVWIKTGGG